MVERLCRRDLLSVLLAVAACAALAACVAVAQLDGPEPIDIAREARTVYSVTKDYFQKRLDSEWQAMYDYQSPEFKKRVSFAEYLYFDGQVAHNHHAGSPFHISGTPQAAEEFYKRNQEKRGFLNLPMKRTYSFAQSYNFKIKKHRIEKIFISKDGRYAKAHIRLEGSGLFPPQLWRGVKEIHLNEIFVDFWEKVDGQWKIALLKDERHISGKGVKFYYVPDAEDAWNGVEFVDVPEEQFHPVPDAPK
jgi:hypothetical protein